jgi:outer membrane protein OmpA-like peptidoglycan-associated protein
MQLLTSVFYTALLLQLSACSNLPFPGRGGMAEHNLGQLLPHPLTPEHGLYFEQELSRRHLDILVLAGAKVCFPASVKLASLRQQRIARELRGGLEWDLANDLIIQREQLALLERRLDYVKQTASCTPDKKELDIKVSSVDPVSSVSSANSAKSVSSVSPDASTANKQDIELLLNSNNQFATDSSALNPKYLASLAMAAVLLLKQPEYTLKITGHADATGTESHNLALSLDRAKQVQRYLQIFGLKEKNMVTSASGENAPLFSSNQPQIRLINRRVSIELQYVDTSMPMD